MQSYDFFLNVVSVTHGKGGKRARREAANNQGIMEGRAFRPMEKYLQGHGNGAGSWAARLWPGGLARGASIDDKLTYTDIGRHI